MKRQYEDIAPAAPAKPEQLHTLWSRLKKSITVLGPIGPSIAAIVLWYISYVQIKAMRAQNEVAKSQNTLTKSVSTAQAEREEARFKSQEVRDILINANAPVESQIYALQQFPDAMRMEVHGINGEKSYPNAESLRRLLLLYIRQPHGSEHDRLPALSSEIVKLLHKLGPVDPKHPGLSLWELRDTATEGKCKTTPSVRKLKGDGEDTFDFTHMQPNNFVSFQAQGLFSDKGAAQIIFPIGANFGSANFQGADLSKCKLKGATFRDCNLKHARLPPDVEAKQQAD